MKNIKKLSIDEIKKCAFRDQEFRERDSVDWMLQRENETIIIENADKASLTFHTDHSKGSLAKVLAKISDGGINLSKLQSFPIPGSDFKYAFHADMEFDSLDQFYKVMEKIKSLTDAVRIYGVYKRGIRK